MQRFSIPDDVSIEGLPSSFWLLVIGIALFAFGVALEIFGFPTEAGITGALAIFFLVIAVLAQLLFWGLGQIE